MRSLWEDIKTYYDDSLQTGLNRKHCVLYRESGGPNDIFTAPAQKCYLKSLKLDKSNEPYRFQMLCISCKMKVIHTSQVSENRRQPVT